MMATSREVVVTVCDCIGLAAVSGGCFLIAIPLGFIVAGFAFIALGWLLSQDEAA
jgi:hypothetical protein